MTADLLKFYQVPHAATMLRALRENRAALDASDTGTGKTFVALWLAGCLGAIPLVVCPKSSQYSWEKASAIMGVPAEVVGYEKARGIRRVKLATSNVFCKENGKPLCGPFIHRLSESVWGYEEKMGSGSRWRWHDSYGLVIFDEVQRCGGFTSLNSKMLIGARRQAAHLLLLSATAADDPRDLKAIGFALRMFELHGFRNWLLRHGCKPGLWGGFDFSGNEIVQQGAMLKIHKAIFPARGSRMVKKDIPGFPKTILDVKLIPDESGKAARLTEECAEAFKNNHLEQRTRLRQKLELLRLPAMADLAEDYGKSSKVVVFLNYTKSADQMAELLAKVFGAHVPILDGRNTTAARRALITAWQLNEFPGMVVNIRAGGAGCNLEDPTGEIDRTTIISPCDSGKDMEQVTGRVNRVGGGFSQQFFTYFADTLEATIAQAVSRSMANMATLNDAILHGAEHGQTTRNN